MIDELGATMRSFTLRGNYSNDDVSPEQGTIIVTPTPLPIIDLAEEQVVRSPIVGKIDDGLFEVQLPAAGAFTPVFTLEALVRMNDGSTTTFNVPVQGEGTEVDLSEILSTTP